MKGMLLTCPTNMRVLDETPLDAPPTLEQLRAAIGGGYIELVPYWQTINHRRETHRCVAFCDEHGKGNGLPLNGYATVLWRFAQTAVGVKLSDYLVGPVIIIYGDDELMEAMMN